MIQLDGATVLLQWATGGLLFLWVTTRRRQVGLGYGWLLRSVYGLMAIGALLIGLRFDSLLLRDLAAAGVAVAAGFALAQSILRRERGVARQRALAEARSARVAAQTGIDRRAVAKRGDGPEFDPRLDLVAPVIGMIGVIAAAVDAGGSTWLAVARFVTGTVFLGAVSDAMLLGHWYLVQPGLSREPISELVRWTGISWLPEVALLLVPTGMLSVWSGAIDDGWSGMLGWFWGACAVATIGLVVATVVALRERQYSAVMAATGLLYLAILTAFGTDLVARALLAA